MYGQLVLDRLKVLCSGGVNILNQQCLQCMMNIYLFFEVLKILCFCFLQEMFRDIDKNGDGQIMKEEFLLEMMKMERR